VLELIVVEVLCSWKRCKLFHRRGQAAVKLLSVKVLCARDRTLVSCVIWSDEDDLPRRDECHSTAKWVLGSTVTGEPQAGDLRLCSSVDWKTMKLSYVALEWCDLTT